MTERDPLLKMHNVTVSNQTQQAVIDEERLKQGVCLVLEEQQIQQAVVGLAIVTDRAIQEMNRKYLKHDYPTDVLSFPLSADNEEPLEGEIAISLETAVRRATEYRWRTEDELLLYAIHGALHLVGFLDHSTAERVKMQTREKAILARMNVVPPESTKPRGGTKSPPDGLITQNYNAPNPLR